jgi:LmbE family N-acetylglucosaminyl deacetylase
MSLPDALVLIVAAWFATLLTWRAVSDLKYRPVQQPLDMNLLPAAQALQALAKLKDMEDEKLRAILSKFEEKRATIPSAQKQFEEITKRAQAQGFVIDMAAQNQSHQPSNFAPVTPAPDAAQPDWGTNFVE